MAVTLQYIQVSPVYSRRVPARGCQLQLAQLGIKELHRMSIKSKFSGQCLVHLQCIRNEYFDHTC